MNDQADLLPHIINGYRDIIKNRYDYRRIQSIFSLPPSVDKSVYDKLIQFFLEYIYPPFERRSALNKAFEQLESYVDNPRKLLIILKDSFGIILKYGVHLPKILRTGLKAMHSFKNANNFELELAKIAQSSEGMPPFTKNDIDYFLKQIPRERLDAFVDNGLQLFQILNDEKLVLRIVDIVSHIIEKMEHRKNLYKESEIQALKLGRKIVKGGFEIFKELDPSARDFLFKSVEHLERATIAAIFESNEPAGS